jgi:hypothetical protein
MNPSNNAPAVELEWPATAEHKANLEKVLDQVLRLAEQRSSADTWSIYSLWAVGQADSSMNIPEFEQAIAKQPKGLHKSVREIRELLAPMSQVNEVLIVSAQSEAFLPERGHLETTGRFETMIELEDSSRIRIRTRSMPLSEALIEMLSFRKARA